MFKINKDVEYALISLRALAEEDSLISAKELSSRFHIPSGILAKILQRLCHGQIIQSVQGPKGGYRLAVAPDQITLGNVIDVVHGPERIVPCIEEPGSCGQEATCTIKHSFETVQGLWLEFLHRMTLSQFVSISGEDGSLEGLQLLKTTMN